MTDVESTNGQDEVSRGRINASRGDKHVDGVFMPLIYQRGNRLPTDIVEATADEWEPVRGEINDRR